MTAPISYLDQYVEGLRFLHELHPDYNPDFDQIRANIVATQTTELAERYRNATTILKRLAERQVVDEGGHPALARRCHAVCDGFLRRWKAAEISKVVELTITIGNVYFHGESLYPTTKDSLKTIIQRGPKTSDGLDVHVWLTLENLTVVDLTILPSLRRRGKYNGILTDAATALIWREGGKSKFHYEPILVHNDFFSEVDQGFILRR